MWILEDHRLTLEKKDVTCVNCKRRMASFFANNRLPYPEVYINNETGILITHLIEHRGNKVMVRLLKTEITEAV